MSKLNERLMSLSDSLLALCRVAPFLKNIPFLSQRRDRTLQVQQFMSTPVAVCHRSAKLSEAAQLMWEKDCGAVPVVDDQGTAIALLTDRDICMAAYTQGKPLGDIAVSSAMSQWLVACHPEDSVELAEQLMSKHQVHRLPVINQEGQPVGILSLSDLARAALEAPQDSPGGAAEPQLTAAARTFAAVCAQRRPGPSTPVA